MDLVAAALWAGLGMTFLGAFILGWLFGQRNAARRYEDRVEDKAAAALARTSAGGRHIQLSHVRFVR